MHDMTPCKHGNNRGYCRECNPEPPEFKVWFDELVRLAPHYTDTSYDDWECYFTDGQSPQQALDEDSSYD